MTIHELLDKHNIKYEKLKADKGINLFKVGNTNVLFWINDGNAFKMKRNWFERLEENCDRYALFLYDKKGKQYYYIKFLNKISIGESTSTLHEKEVNPSNSRFNMYDRIQKRELNVSQEYARIWKLFNTGDIVGPRATSLRVYMDGCIQFFPNTFRRRSLTLHDFNEIYGFEFKPPHESITEDQLVSYCEYVITLCDYLWEYAGDCLDEDAEDLREALYETVESCIDELGLTSTKKDGITIYIDKDPAVVAVAELLEESLAYDAKSFIHKGTKGNLYKKKTILKFLADEIENDKKALRSINKALESNLFQMLNKFIRHNNEENLFIKSLSPENLEACYDDIYQMWLLAKLELSNLERKKRVEDILRKINL